MEEVIIDEEVLSRCVTLITNYEKSVGTAYVELCKKISAQQTKWNDEDYEALVDMIGSLKQDVSAISESSSQLTARIKKRLEYILGLRNLKIGG